MQQIKTKKILVDGFNLIYKFPELEERMYARDLPGALSGMIRILAAFAKTAKKTVTVVFDGRKKEGSDLDTETIAGIRVHYSLDSSADYVIMQAMKMDRQPRMTTVITSDKAIIGYLKKFGTPVITSEEFAEIHNRIMNPEIKDEEEKQPDVQLSPDEISYWEKLFTKRK